MGKNVDVPVYHSCVRLFSNAFLTDDIMKNTLKINNVFLCLLIVLI